MESTSLTTVKSRTMVLSAVLVLLGLPVALAMIEAVWFHVRNRSTGAIISSGQKREYVLYVPRSYDSSKPAALVISMHGAGSWGAAQQEISRWNEVADSEGLVVVYPSGAAGSGPRVWELDEGPGLTRDVRFISDLIDTLQAHYNIDPARVYADGLSAGGGMAFVLSCTLSDRIAAIGMVAAARLSPWSWCTDSQPVPMIAFHGTGDRQVPYNGGTYWMFKRRFPDVSTRVANWARRNRCAPNPVDSLVAPDVTRRAYTDCADDAHVVLYTITGGGHTWPGGTPLPEWFAGSTSNSVHATSLMWAFFREHPLRPTQSAAAPKTRTNPWTS